VTTQSLAIVGFGDIGRRVAQRLPSSWRAVALRRRAGDVPPGVRGIAVDLTVPESLQCLERLAPEALLITLSPAQRSVEGYREGFDRAMASIIDGLGPHRPRHAFFVSSTRVYAETAGAWIDEEAPLARDGAQAEAIIDAEERFLAGLPGATVLRAGGLYGHGPGPLLRAVAAGRLRPSAPLIYGNRIHRDDLAAFLVHSLERDIPDRVINLVDDAPVPQQEVEAWLCRALGRPYDPPPADPRAAAPRHKRIRNARLHRSAYALTYPDYRAGYAGVIARWVEHSEREDGLDLD